MTWRYLRNDVAILYDVFIKFPLLGDVLNILRLGRWLSSKASATQHKNLSQVPNTHAKVWALWHLHAGRWSRQIPETHWPAGLANQRAPAPPHRHPNMRNPLITKANRNSNTHSRRILRLDPKSRHRVFPEFVTLPSSGELIPSCSHSCWFPSCSCSRRVNNGS